MAGVVNKFLNASMSMWAAPCSNFKWIQLFNLGCIVNGKREKKNLQILYRQADLGQQKIKKRAINGPLSKVLAKT